MMREERMNEIYDFPSIWQTQRL
ncbi:hypothetical protein EMIT0P218_20439 [Pseudomonas sp. IT-P218]